MGNKFKARSCIVGTTRYASQKEMVHCEGLKLLERAGKIEALMLQPKYPVWINGHKCFTYVADATYVENGKQIIVDVKGVHTPLYRVKRKCVEAYYGIKITEV